MSQALLEEYIETGNIIELSALLKAQPQLAIQKTSQHVSPIMLSSYYKKPEIAEILFNYSPNITIYEAVALNKLDIIKDALNINPTIINEFSDDGFSLLYLASYFGNENITHLLLLKGANPNIPSNNVYRIYPLHIAVENKFTMIAKMLIEGGADCSFTQFSGISPLHLAAKNGNIDLLIVLLEAGANVNIKNHDGKSPADLALENGFNEISKILS
ncbi:ankyrin repeat domain-containing protein [Daejeonella sp.]|jgi:ankyrin repeat protein|uniref:ankyrin repeat domain-containing protein n=1 Tax=Daejeonella sp. TaxID=2805397 RepID=UPI0037BEDEAB